MMRTAWLALMFAVAAGSVSCGRKPDKPGTQPPPATTARPEAKDEPGVGDVVDYAIGKKQLDMKKQIESQLDAIQKDRNRRIEEALGE
jgi:hypothetical protein